MSAPEPPDQDAWARNMVALYCALIAGRVSFYQATYGDGEWKNILGTGRGTNDQGERYCTELGYALRETLLEPAGQWCVLWPGGAGAETRQGARTWIEKHEPPVHWLPFPALSWASVMGLAAPFFRALRTRHVTLVGPAHMRRLDERLLAPDEFVEVPDRTAWKVAHQVAEDGVERDSDLGLVCAGQGACIIVHRLAQLAKCRTVVDVGSMLDPYCGVYSRRAYRDSTFQDDRMPENLP